MDDDLFQDDQEPYSPSFMARVIGASCGAFVSCFIAILMSLPFIKGVEGQWAANLFWIVAFICGGVGGFAFPKISHFSAYLFVLFLNYMLSLAIGRDLGERALLFATFTVAEVVFFLSKRIVTSSEG